MSALANESIVHRDLALRNVLLDVKSYELVAKVAGWFSFFL